MKVENQITDTIKIGQTSSKQATISEHKISKLQYILTKGLYSDPITAVIAEITNNGIDAVVQAGKDPKQFPVLVEIDKNAQGNYFFRVTDKGTGLDKNSFENILMNYLESTKESDANSIGFFGLGSKSFLALERAATFTCRKDGKELKYLAYQGSQFCEYDLLYEKDTTEENGVIFEIPIKDYTERKEFEKKAIQKLAYYETAALVINGNIVNNKILRSQDWQYSEENENNSLHMCLKDVYYEIDFTKLGIQRVDIPIALRFGLSDGIVVTPSRESVIYTDKVKEVILNKIKAVADWFTIKYNEQVPTEYDTIMEVWEDIDQTTKYVIINDTSFKINSLLKYSNTLPKELSVKGIKYRSLSWYKSNLRELLGDYTIVSHKRAYSNIMSQAKNIRGINIQNKILADDKVALVDNIPMGYIRAYLNNKYNDTGCTFVTKSRETKLKSGSLLGVRSYYSILYLSQFPKSEWRGRVEEWQRVEKEFIDKIIDARGVENTKDFKDWLVKHKQFLKDSRIKSGSAYKGLNKQDGDVTISIARYSKVSGDELVLEKKVFKINELYKQPNMFVLFDDKEKLTEYWPLFNRGKVLACIIGKKEINKIPSDCNKKIIKFEQFMSRDCKPFMRIASAILFSKVVDEFEDIQRGRTDLFRNCLAVYYEDYTKLKKYVNDNVIPSGASVCSAILDVAVEKDLLDKQLWDVYLRVKEVVGKLEFVTCLKVPNSWDTEAKRKYDRLINQMLLFQKKYYDLEAYDLVKKPEPETKGDEGFDFWQPIIDDGGEVTGHPGSYISSYEVWKDKAKLVEEYPNCTPIGYKHGDIEEPTFVDEAELEFA